MSLMQQMDTTRIGRLTVRGPAGTRDQLLPQLESGRWPAPTDGSWVLVRRVAVSAGPVRLANELLESARQTIDSGDPDKVIRFPTLAALLAELISDLVNGTAAQRWYWQRWSRLWPLPPGDAIQQLMQQHPQQLLPACDLLAARGRLTATWQCLSPANATGLLGVLGHELGLSAPTPPGSALAWPSAKTTPAIPPRLSQAWQPVLKSLTPKDPRATLAAMIVAADCAALSLRTAPDRTLTSMRQQLTKPAVQPLGPADRLTNQHANPQSGTRTTVSSTPEHDSNEHDPSLPGPKTDREVQTNSIRGNHEENRGTPDSTRSGVDAPEQPGHERPGPEAENTAEAAVRPGDRLYTEMGGTPYLLNFLNRRPVQTIMEQNWQALPSGWAWLYRLGRELELDPEDALCDLLADRLGLESADQLETLPPLPCRSELLSLAAQWYGQQELWRPSLLRIPAEFSASPGHLDLFMDDSEVELELRLAGLDLNPGWLPWLGTVVTFHFDHYPHLRRTRS